MLFHCIYQGKNEETGELNPEYTDDDYEFLCGKLNEMTLKILNSIESKYNILNLYCFVRSDNWNFRKKIYPEYKKGRSIPNPIIWKLYEYAKLCFNTVSSSYAEADDYLWTFSKRVEHNAIICGVDGDLQCVPSLHFNPTKDEWKKIDKDTAIYNMYSKICIGCSSDGVNLSPKIGEAYYKKNFVLGDSIENYEANLLNAYIKAWGNEEIAKEKLELAKKLLKLWDIESPEFKLMIQNIENEENSKS